MAMVAFLISLPPLCGAVLFWAMIVVNTIEQGFGILPKIEGRFWAAGAAATVAALLFIFLGCTLLYPKGDPHD